MEWMHAAGNTWFVDLKDALAAICITGSGEAVLIDSGREERQELLTGLEARGLRVRAVLCTHLHRDHTANNLLLHTRHGAEIFATQAQINDREEVIPYPITTLGEEGGSVTIGGAVFESLPTPGHTPGQLAFVTPDGVCCVGDALLTLRRLAKAKLPYLEDVDTAIATMEALRQTDYPLYLASHDGLISRQELWETVEENIEKELEVYRQLRDLVQRPMAMDALVTAFMTSIGIRRSDVLQDVSYRATIRRRVESLVRAGEVGQRGGILFPIKNRSDR